MCICVEGSNRTVVSTIWRKFLTVENLDESGLGEV